MSIVNKMNTTYFQGVIVGMGDSILGFKHPCYHCCRFLLIIIFYLKIEPID